MQYCIQPTNCYVLRTPAILRKFAIRTIVLLAHLRQRFRQIHITVSKLTLCASVETGLYTPKSPGAYQINEMLRGENSKIFRGTTRFEKKDCSCFSTLIRNVDESYLPTFEINHINRSTDLLRQCSCNQLFQTALSVGDAVFLSVSGDPSLLQRIYCSFVV